MKVLYISPIIPWPVDRGNRVRIYNFLKELSSRHEVDAIFAVERTSGCLAEAEKELKPYCRGLYLVKQPNWGLLPRAFLFAASKIAYYLLGMGQAEFYKNLGPLNKAIRRLLAQGEYDVLLSNYWFTAIKSIKKASCPTICDTHDVIWENVVNSNKKTPSAIYNWFQQRHADRIKYKESEVLNAYDHIICVTDRDCLFFEKQLQVTTKSDVIATIRSDKRMTFALPKVEKDTLLFFGALHTGMNIDGARYAALELYPEIKKKCPNARLVIAGSGVGPAIQELGKLEGVTIVGYVPDLEALFHDAKILFLPLRMGSGIKGRVLEAMEAGLPVVGSSFMSEGIPAIHGESIVVSDDPGALIDWAVKLLVDDESRCRIARNARDFIERNYSWENTYGKVHGILEEVTRSNC